jgi:hypothetical protein
MQPRDDRQIGVKLDALTRAQVLAVATSASEVSAVAVAGSSPDDYREKEHRFEGKNRPSSGRSGGVADDGSERRRRYRHGPYRQQASHQAAIPDRLVIEPV